ncbi:MAG: hypothetical protein A3E81_01800 [Gammaproteobacteria bacterium RIFCSPHIGHO2_12_FULL_36_30]|nr:MAG: hypothetical protein A3E81_01800 [Gammaproteobacteria bacterium RIFCSPHIGHO2_12_FULL_36_30]
MARTEAQIVESWLHTESPLVSVICITYNHEPYIADAIESFLKQKTTFPFEIIIHDDASTDKTSEIVKSYTEKYPRIIKPIFQKENQSSQFKKNVLLPIILTAVSYARGKFIAYCDGDDYWTDENKLEIQIAVMQKNPNCDMSFHPVFRKSSDRKKRNRIIAKHSSQNKIFFTKQLVLGAAQFCPTTSFIFKSNIFKSIPQWLFDAPCTDYFLQILASLRGGAIYISRVMAVYRAFSLGSWSGRMTKEENLVNDYFVGMLQSLKDINLHTAYQYDKEIAIITKKLCFYMCINPTLSLKRRKKIFSENKKLLNISRRILWFLLFNNTKLPRFFFNAKNYIFH